MASLSTPVESQEVFKRRIGMRLPNMLTYRPTTVEKRRIGMRLPNIIYLRSEPEKKNWDVAELEEEDVGEVISNGRSQSRSTERLQHETQHQYVVYKDADRKEVAQDVLLLFVPNLSTH
ncbi:hypothetical protein ANCCEY_14456 [Ancylostoma ceylanicum]|nr:hypothetical protein ANCCEY_14456 [Ancylostoma ceylanicum]